MTALGDGWLSQCRRIATVRHNSRRGATASTSPGLSKLLLTSETLSESPRKKLLPNNPKVTVAPLDSLDPQVAADIIVLREFTMNRERHMAQLFGRKVRRSPARDELLRLITLALSRREHLRVSTYLRICRDFASGPSIRAEIDTLVHAGLVILDRDPAHPRAFLVLPTTKLVTFYNEQLPRLRDEVAQLLQIPELSETHPSRLLKDM
jgi:hypothetical protein